MDELYQRSRRLRLASVAATQLAMEAFLYELACMENAIFDLEVDISTAKADLGKLEAKHADAEKNRKAAILQFQVTYIGSFHLERQTAAMLALAATIVQAVGMKAIMMAMPTVIVTLVIMML